MVVTSSTRWPLRWLKTIVSTPMGQLHDEDAVTECGRMDGRVGHVERGGWAQSVGWRLEADGNVDPLVQ